MKSKYLVTCLLSTFISDTIQDGPYGGSGFSSLIAFTDVALYPNGDITEIMVRTVPFSGMVHVHAMRIR